MAASYFVAVACVGGVFVVVGKRAGGVEEKKARLFFWKTNHVWLTTHSPTHRTPLQSMSKDISEAESRSRANDGGC